MTGDNEELVPSRGIKLLECMSRVLNMTSRPDQHFEAAQSAWLTGIAGGTIGQALDKRRNIHVGRGVYTGVGVFGGVARDTFRDAAKRSRKRSVKDHVGHECEFW